MSAGHERCLELLTAEQTHRWELIKLVLRFGFVDALDDVRRYQGELDLTERQQAYFHEARKEQMIQRLDLLEKELNGTLNEELAEKLLQNDGVATVYTKKDVELKLTKAQSKRLEEMRWRYAMMLDGLAFFARPEIQEWLEFSDGEKADIKERVDEANRAESELGRAMARDGEAYKEYLHSLSSERIRLLKQLVGPPVKGDSFMKFSDPLKDF